MLLVLSGPSGAGKDAVCDALSKTMLIDRLPAYTTRTRRPSEIEGVHYRYVTRAQFEQLQSDAEFFDMVDVNGCLYGTPFQDFLDASRADNWFIISMAVRSALMLRKELKTTCVVYVLPPSRGEQIRRLIHRGYSEFDAQARLCDDPDETGLCLDADYIVVNYRDELAATAERVRRYLQEKPIV